MWAALSHGKESQFEYKGDKGDCEGPFSVRLVTFCEHNVTSYPTFLYPCFITMDSVPSNYEPK